MPLLRHSSSGDLCGCFPQPFTDRIAIIQCDADVSVSHGALLHRDWCAQFVQPREVADRTIQPELERFVAKRMGATTFETASSHVPMLSQPDFVLDVIRKAATSVQKKKAA